MDEALYRLHAECEETYWWWVGKNRIILSLIDRYAPAPPRIPNASDDQLRRRALDIGCGAGGVLAKLAARFDAVGVDMSPIARDYCANRGLKALDGRLPDSLPFTEPESFDVIVLSEVIEHVHEDRASIQSVARLLRPGGTLISTVPAHMWLWSRHDDFNMHQRRYTRRQFASLFDGLTTVDGRALTLTPRVLSYYQAASLPLIAGARALEHARSRLTGRPIHGPEVRPLPGPINQLLTWAFQLERHILPYVGLPWGTSVISVHQRTTGA